MEKKLVNLLVKKIYDKFSTKPGRETTRDASHPAEDRPPEIKGKEIGKMLAASSLSCRSEPTRELRSRKKGDRTQISKDK